MNAISSRAIGRAQAAAEPRKYTLPDGSIVTDADFAEGDIVPWLLTPEEDEARLRGLRQATGRASWWEYPLFRGFIQLIGYLLVKRVFVDTDKVPGGLNWHPKHYRRRNFDFIRRGGHPKIIVAPNHADERDILMTGSFRRPLVWTCKPWFCSGPMWLARWCHINGAFPINRRGIDCKFHPTKNNLAMIHHHQMRSYKGDEGLQGVIRAVNHGFDAEFFMEGTRKGDALVEGGFFGAIRVARHTGALLQPIAIVGVSEGDPIIRPGRAPWRRVLLGVVCDPINPMDYQDFDTERQAEEAMMADWAAAINDGKTYGRGLIKSHGKQVGLVPPRHKAEK